MGIVDTLTGSVEAADLGPVLPHEHLPLNFTASDGEDFEPGSKRIVRGWYGAILDELRKMDWVPRLVRQRGETPIGMSNFSEFTSHKNESGDGVSEEFVVADQGVSVVDKVEMRMRIEDAISQLKPRYQEAVRLYFWNGLTLKGASKFMGTTESRVCQIIQTVKVILGRSLESD